MLPEIRGFEPPTRIANAPGCMKGVVHLHVVIVPIIDMRVRLDLINLKYDAFSVVILLSVASRTVAIVVGSVSDVLALRPTKSSPRPHSMAASRRPTSPAWAPWHLATPSACRF